MRKIEISVRPGTKNLVEMTSLGVCAFEDMVLGLEENARLGYIHVVDMLGSGGKVKLYNYTRKTTFEGRWNQWTCKARGLILDLEKKTVVAHPFPKFFQL